MMDGHPFRQDPLIAKANPVSGVAHPTDNPTTEQNSVPDCQSCGACCAEAGAVTVYWTDQQVPRHLTRSVRGRMGYPSDEWEEGTREMAKDIGGRCKALKGEIGTNCKCGIYDRRPAVCRDFDPGAPGCLAARERMAWKLSRMDWKPHGYGPEFALPSPALTTEGA